MTYTQEKRMYTQNSIYQVVPFCNIIIVIMIIKYPSHQLRMRQSIFPSFFFFKLVCVDSRDYMMINIITIIYILSFILHLFHYNNLSPRNKGNKEEKRKRKKRERETTITRLHICMWVTPKSQTFSIKKNVASSRAWPVCPTFSTTRIILGSYFIINISFIYHLTRSHIDQDYCISECHILYCIQLLTQLYYITDHIYPQI